MTRSVSMDHCVREWPPVHWMFQWISNDNPLVVSHSPLYLACWLFICLSMIDDCWTTLSTDDDGSFSRWRLVWSLYFDTRTHMQHTHFYTQLSPPTKTWKAEYFSPLMMLHMGHYHTWVFRGRGQYFEPSCVFYLVIHVNSAKLKGIPVIHR